MAEQWFYAVAKERKGPVDTAALKQLAATGVITATTLIWKKGMPAWTPAGQIAGIIEATPPPLPEPETKSGPPPLPSTQPVSSPPTLPPKSSSGPPPLPPKKAGPPPLPSTAACSPANNLVAQLRDPKKLPWVIAGAAALVILMAVAATLDGSPGIVPGGSSNRGIPSNQQTGQGIAPDRSNSGYPPGYQPLDDPNLEALRQQNIRRSELLQNTRKAYSDEPITWTFPPASQQEADERARIEKMAAYNRSLTKSLRETREAFRPR